jgi:DNA-binding NtrC family response regulator
MDASLRESLRYHLTGLRWQVLEAPGGAEAWMAASEASQLEALLIDSWLPDLDVNEFLADFRRDYPQVDIVMTDGVPTRDGPKSAYRQELLYALRRTQDGDTALWQSAPAILDTPAISDLPPLGQRRSPAATTSSSPSQARFAAQAADRMADRISERSPGLPASPSFSQPVSQLEPQSGTRAEVRSQAGGPVPSDSTANHAIQSLPTIQSQSAGPRRNGYSPTLSPVDRSLMEASRPAELIGEGAPVPPAETLGPNRGELRAPGRAAGAQREALGWEPLPTLIGNSHAMLEVSRRIRLVAGRTTPVLIEGPTGSGKELVAAGLHRLSERSRKPMIAINCAAIPEPLLEAELFGHTRGAFTGAVTGRVGRIEAADGGTLFLDEIGEMPLGLQSKLLRFFESGELQRIGDNETIRVDARIVAATHQPLAEHAQQGQFRADLYYRLAVFLIRTPALAEHMEDLPLLVQHFLDRMGRKSPVKRLHSSAMARLEGHGWPGNVRELEHVLERAAILAGDSPVITADEIDFGHSLLN